MKKNALFLIRLACSLAIALSALNTPEAPADETPNPVPAAGDYVHYVPFNDGFVEIDLTQLEVKKFVRSQPVLSPKKERMVYSEILYNSMTDQVFSKLYLVSVPPLILRNVDDPLPPLIPPKPADSPSAKEAKAPEITPPEKSPVKAPEFPSLEKYTSRFDPNQTLQDRALLYETGQDRKKFQGFKTLTAIDWSASGRRLLFKQKNGILHYGLAVSDILIYDYQQGTVTLYPEIKRAIAYYWDNKHIMPPLTPYAWDLSLLGWEPGSDSQILLKAWAYDKKEKKFLGLWRYDVDAKRTELLSLKNNAVDIVSNGWRMVADAEKYRRDRALFEKNHPPTDESTLGKMKAFSKKIKTTIQEHLPQHSAEEVKL